ncbi:hypothetical protein IAT38_003226 [Cryptococcus sp. DSM 104549]
MARYSHTEAILGKELFQKVKDTKILVVGAGGIGCELLKNLVLVGFANIEIIDLDTIDLSNLNRQFLFRKPDISKPKALVAAATARHFNPSSGIEIHARHGNVKDSVNDLEWIKGFGLVMSALDNMDARRHVNRLCQAGNVPLIESGTAGYRGQVTPFIHNETECFDCTEKVPPKSFPVCTIRSTPSEPIHCIVWGKTYLFGKLFGEDDEDMDTEELDKAKEGGENAEEIENLKKESAAFRQVRQNLGEEDGPRRVFEKVFNEDINRLLAMEDMWKKEGRVKPVPLEYDPIMDGSFVVPPLRAAPAPAAGSSAPKEATAVSANGEKTNGNAEKPAAPKAVNKALLKDQRELSVKDNLELFIDSCKRLSARAIAYPDVLLSFDKDDDDTLDFVLATANLRATAYGIANKTRFEVKEMAGNIIPAIATTNAMVAGLIVMQSLHQLTKLLSATAASSAPTIPFSSYYLRGTPAKPLAGYPQAPPADKCAVCRDVYVQWKVDTSRCTLGQFVEGAVKGWLGGAEFAKPAVKDGEANGDAEAEGEEVEWTVFEGGRLLADPDFEDNFEKTLGELGIGRGKIVTVMDEDGRYRPVHFCVCEPEANSTAPYTLPANPPAVPLAYRPPPPPVERAVSVLSDDIEVTPPSKPKAAAVVEVMDVDAADVTPSSKKRTATEAGEEVEEGKEGGAKKRKVVVVQDEEDDFFEITGSK